MNPCATSLALYLTVGGATFGHRLKARAQFECNDKVSSRLGKPSSQRASSFGRRPRRLRRKPIRHRRRRREVKNDEDRGAYGEDWFVTGEDEEKRRITKTEAPTAKTGSPQAKTKRSEEWQRSRCLRRRPVGHRRRRREAERGEDRGTYGED